MPTLDGLTASGEIVKVGGGLRAHQQPVRRLYAVANVIEWMKTVLPTARSDEFVIGAAHPIYQVDNLFNRFVSGDDFDWPLPHPMHPDNVGIYRIRTDDVRLNGWIPERCCFVIGSVGLKQGSTTAHDNALRDTAISERERLQINDGAFLLGDYRDHL